MDSEFENQQIGLEKNEEYEDIDQLKAQEEYDKEETTKQLSPQKVNTVLILKLKSMNITENMVCKIDLGL